MNKNNKIKRKVFVDYENFMGAVIGILKGKKDKPQSSKFEYSHFKKFLESLAQNIETEIFCYYEDKASKDEEQQRTRLVDYFLILQWQLEEQKISFNAFGMNKVSVDSGILTALARTVIEDEVQQIYLVSGDADYAGMLQFLSEQTKKIVIISGKDCFSGILKVVADEIQYIDDSMRSIMS